MKAMSYICLPEDLEEKKAWLIDMGLKPFRQTPVSYLNGNNLEKRMQIYFFVLDEEILTYLSVTYPSGTFRDCSA